MNRSDDFDPGDGRRQLALSRAIALAVVAALAVALAVPEARLAVAVALAAFVLGCSLLSHSGPIRRIEAEGPRGRAPLWPDSGAKSVVEAMGEPAFLVDRSLLLRFQNAVSERVFGAMPLGDAISLRFRSPELLATIESCVRERKAGSASLVEGRSAERAWGVEVLPVPVSKSGNPAFFLLLFHDRTAERRIEQMRTDFIANASHELRTPLASLIGFIETLQGPAREDAGARTRFLDIMRDQAARMSRLIDDLLSLSRIEMKRHLPVEDVVDLADVLGEVLEALTPMAAEGGIVLEAGPVAEPLAVAGERDELVQVFANLVENACKYGGSGGRVVVRLSRVRERGKTYVDASVEDFGPGIAPEHVPRLTERFYRVDVGVSGGKKGTGLGLSIVRNILVRHRGRLIVQSTVGKGSTFTARLPAIDKPD